MVDDRSFQDKSIDNSQDATKTDLRSQSRANLDRVSVQCPVCGVMLSQATLICPSDGTLLQQSERAGTVPNYQLVRLIGAGGMGNVYEAEHVVLRNRVAIKILKPHLLETSAFSRFQQEARAANKLQHPNIVSVYDCGMSLHGEPYMIMNLIVGETLDTTLKRGPMSVADSLSIAGQICAGVGCAHTHGLLHRDLKPSNIIVEYGDAKPVAKILDFGIAKLIDNDQVGLLKTRTGEIFGTPAYMSPEQAEGTKLDQRSDLYSIGCILYEMLTGQPPVVGKTAMEILYKHVNETPLSLTQASLGKTFPPNLERIVQHCLERDPQKRFSSAEELSTAIDEFMSGRELSIIAKSKPSISVRSDRLRIMAIWTGVALIAAASIFVVIKSNSEPEVKKTAVQSQAAAIPGTQTEGSEKQREGSGKQRERSEKLHAPELAADKPIASNQSDLSYTGDDEKFRKLLESTGPRLRKLKSVPVLIHNSSLNQLKNYQKLTFLDLSNCRQLTDDGLPFIVQIPGLKDLNLSDTQITDAAILQINSMKHLTALDLADTKIHDIGLAALHRDLPLESLVLRGDDISNDGLNDLHGFNYLKILRVDACRKIDDKGISKLVDLPNLQELDLNETSVTDGIIEPLKKMPKLQAIGLSHTKISGKLIRAIADGDCVPNMLHLNIRGCPNITSEDIAYIKKNRPQCNVNYLEKKVTIPESMFNN